MIWTDPSAHRVWISLKGLAKPWPVEEEVDQLLFEAGAFVDILSLVLVP
jgi:hypothetical protein